jgi:hypothetical protein
MNRSTPLFISRFPFNHLSSKRGPWRNISRHRLPVRQAVAEVSTPGAAEQFTREGVPLP